MGLNFILSEMFFAFFEGVVYLLLFLIITNKRDFIKTNKVDSLIFATIFSILSYILTAYIPTGIHTLAHIALLILLLSTITHTNLYSSVIALIFSSVLILIVEILVILVLIMILGVDMYTISSHERYLQYAQILSKSLELTLTLILYFKSKFFMNIGIFKKENSSFALPLFEIFIIILFASSFNGLTGSKSNILVYNVIFLVITASLVYLNIMEYKQREKILQIKSRFASQQRYVEDMQTVIEIIRKEKHDFANHLNTIAGICTLKKDDALDKVSEYLKGIIGNYQPACSFYASGSDFIDGLLAVKSNFAYLNGIHMDVDFDAPLNDLNISDKDMVSVISNIIDNAFDAMCNDKRDYKKVLSVLSYSEDDKLCISISNNGPEIPENVISKIFNQGFSTKGHKGERGYGLFIIRQLIKDNGGDIYITSTDKSTEFLIKLNRNK